MDTTGRPRRVLQLISDLGIGGAQEVVRSLVPHLDAAGWHPVVATFRDGPLRAAIEESGIRVHLLEARRHQAVALHRSVPELARIRAELLALCAREGITVVQTHLLRSLDFVALTLLGRAGVESLFMTVHNSVLDLRADQLPDRRWLLGPKRAGYRWGYRTAAHRGARFVAVSEDVGAAIREGIRPPASRVHVIGNGVDVARYQGRIERSAVRTRLGIATDAPVVICVAKLHPQKGHADLLVALPTVLRSHPGTVVLLAGEGPLRDQLAASAEAMGITGNVRLLGPRDDVPELLAAADLFVLPSLWEGLPMALLEAMASGLPVVATEVSGTRQVVAPEATGIIVPVRDPDALAAAMRQLLADPLRARAMGQAGRERIVRGHSVEGQARAHAALYEASIRERAVSRRRRISNHSGCTVAPR